jgi:hypothetical protein
MSKVSFIIFVLYVDKLNLKNVALRLDTTFTHYAGTELELPG